MIANNIVVYDHDAKLSDHFRVHEFCIDGTGKVLTFIDPKLVWILEGIRRQTKEPLYIQFGNDGDSKMHQCGMAATVRSDTMADVPLYGIALDFVPDGHAKIVKAGVEIDSNF